MNSEEGEAAKEKRKMNDSPLMIKSKELALEVIKVCKELRISKCEVALINQFLRSGTSVAATGRVRTCGFSSFGRARPCQGRGGGFEPRNPLHQMSFERSKLILIRRHSQAVRQRSAKPSFPGPIPGGASKNPAQAGFFLIHYSLFTLH